MSLLSGKRLNLVRSLIRALPQSSLRSLDTALALTKDEALTQVRDIIGMELEFRYTREAIFDPFVALFQPRRDGLASVTFQPWILDRLWLALEHREPELFTASRYAMRGLRAEDPTPVVFFRLVTAGMELCRNDPDAILPPAASAADVEEVAEFANYLALHRILRGALKRLPDFMGRIDAEKAATLRLMFKDACAVHAEGGYRFIEALFANLDDGAQIVKFMATVSDRPNDRFLAQSELKTFGERILEHIEAQLADVKAMIGPRGRGCDDLGAVSVRITQLLGQLQVFETYIELAREGPWGKRVAAAHAMVAEMAEGQLKGAERILENALPTRSERVYGRVRKETPRFDKPPSDEVVARARQTLDFVRQVRNTANAGGFASLHAKTVQALEQALDSYFEELLAIANGSDPFDPEVVMSVFERVTDLMLALCGEEKAHTARRRVASSDLFKPRETTTAA